MTIRIIVRTDNAAMAVNVGGSVETLFRTFDIEAPELEAYLREPYNQQWKYFHRLAIGVEVIDAKLEKL